MASSSSFFSAPTRQMRVIALASTLAFAAAFAPGGCTLNTAGLPGGGGGAASTGTSACAGDASCDDHNPCTVDTCAAGFCSSTPDDTLVPSDGHPCTEDVCKGGVASHPPTPKGTLCAPTSALTCDGNGNCPACSTDIACGMPSADGCTVPRCVSAICKDTFPDGTPSTIQTPHDCQIRVCGPNGGATLKPDLTDTPADDGNACTTQSCNADGTVATAFVAEGAPCPGGLCDGAGVCFGCNADTDCTTLTAPTCDLANHVCIGCADGILNGQETGIDCGGPKCKACIATGCSIGPDCASGHCADGVCCKTDCAGSCQSCNLPGTVGACTNVPLGQPDGFQCPTTSGQACDGNGACKTAAGVTCTTGSDCATGVCSGGTCHVQTNGACASNLACGSGLCVAGQCANCSAGSQCATLVCAAPTCKAPGGAACAADSDCLAGKCQFGLCLVDNGSACSVNADCRSGVCIGSVCVPCGPSAPCSPGASCFTNAFGPQTCNRPPGAYCASFSQCEGLNKCVGVPPTCQ